MFKAVTTINRVGQLCVILSGVTLVSHFLIVYHFGHSSPLGILFVIGAGLNAGLGMIAMAIGKTVDALEKRVADLERRKTGTSN